jgi:hypothetical protein
MVKKSLNSLVILSRKNFYLDKGDNMDKEEKELGFMVMEALALLLSHNQKNASKDLLFVV